MLSENNVEIFLQEIHVEAPCFIIAEDDDVCKRHTLENISRRQLDARAQFFVCLPTQSVVNYCF